MITGTTTTSMIAVELMRSSRSADAIGPLGSRIPPAQPPSVAAQKETRPNKLYRVLGLVGSAAGGGDAVRTRRGRERDCPCTAHRSIRSSPSSDFLSEALEARQRDSRPT